jgi:hypothetical protein
MATDQQQVNSISGVLQQGHFLRDIFPNGLVPLLSPHSEEAILGPLGNQNRENVYMCNLRALSSEQLRKIGIFMAKQSDQTVDECLLEITKFEALPIRITNFIGVTMPLKFFI